MIKYVNGKKIEYEENLPPEPIETIIELPPTDTERLEAIEMALLEILEVMANG